ncbi:MAG: HAD family hydrolase [Candidatus Firestonebacteria bacterium]
MYKAVFLDRDGTINEDVGDFCSPNKLIFIPGAIEALRILQEKFLLFIITNQSGISKGVFTEKEFIRFNKYFNKLLKKEGVVIKKIYYCSHIKEEKCICRKPSSYFLKQAVQNYNIDLRNSYVIGDHPHDIEMGYNVGVSSIYLLTGHGKKHRQDLIIKPDFIATDLYKASIWIFAKNKLKVGKYCNFFENMI